MATEKQTENDANLPFAALQLLAPPLRLVSAAVWKVMKQRDVLQYGVVEEFVSSACETVPGLLTTRHQGKLTLGLRARLILELCYTQPDLKVVEPHLKRIQTPYSTSSAPKADVKVMKAAKKFESLVHALLTNPAKREHFFKEEFPVDYGPVFDQELEKLLWEFLIRLDQLLPVPNLAQTVSWLSSAPPVLEECAHAATQPQLLKTLLEHQRCLGHLEPAGSLPPNMGDPILDSLSLPLSGRVASDQSTEIKTPVPDRSGGAQTSDDAPFIMPVIGSISNEDVPVMMSASTRTVRSDHATNTLMDPKENLQFTVVKDKQKAKADDEKDGKEQPQKDPIASKRNVRRKRKYPDYTQSESDEEEHKLSGMARSGKKRITKERHARGDQRTSKIIEGAKTVRNEECNTKVPSAYVSKLRVKELCLPKDPSLCSVYQSCMRSQPKVMIEKLSLATVHAHQAGRAGQSLHKEQQDETSRSPVKNAAHRTTINPLVTCDSNFPDLDDKENHPVSLVKCNSPSQQRNNTETLVPQTNEEDYVADSEDEVTKNFKGRLFMKRYYKTKHGTYVPTLREFWKPAMTRRNLLSVSNKHK